MSMDERASTQELEQRYLADYVRTATPERRLLMLFDYLKMDLANAKEAFGSGDLKQINDSLVHAQEILWALRDPLDVNLALGAALRRLYTYCMERLVSMNMNKDPQLLPEVTSIIEQIADANALAFEQLSKVEHALA